MCKADQSTDDELVALIRQGDQEASLALIGRYFRLWIWLAKQSFPRSEDAEDAEEVVQEAMLRIFSRVDQYRLGTSFKAWSNEFVRRVALERRSRELLRPIPQQLSEGFDPEYGNQFRAIVDRHSPAEGLLRDKRIALDRAITKLPPEEKEIYSRWKLDDRTGRTAADFAAELGLTVNQFYELIRSIHQKVSQWARQELQKIHMAGDPRH